MLTGVKSSGEAVQWPSRLEGLSVGKVHVQCGCLGGDRLYPFEGTVRQSSRYFPGAQQRAACSIIGLAARVDGVL